MLPVEIQAQIDTATKAINTLKTQCTALHEENMRLTIELTKLKQETSEPETTQATPTPTTTPKGLPPVPLTMVEAARDMARREHGHILAAHQIVSYITLRSKVKRQSAQCGLSNGMFSDSWERVSHGRYRSVL